MKRFPAIALIVLAGACTAGSSLLAQSHEVRANVPFDFVVGSKQMPAGSYKFFAEPNDTVVIANDKQEITVLSRTEEAGDTTVYSSRLIFDRLGDHYFLREISVPSIAINVELPKSKLEKQIGVQTAWLGPERTLIAMY